MKKYHWIILYIHIIVIFFLYTLYDSKSVIMLKQFASQYFGDFERINQITYSPECKCANNTLNSKLAANLIQADKHVNENNRNT